MVKKYIVQLTEEERTELKYLVHKGKAAAHERLHAEIWKDKQISHAFGISIRTVERVRERLVKEGLESALNRAKLNRTKSRIINGENEAHLIALACSEAPEGYDVSWHLIGLLIML